MCEALDEMLSVSSLRLGGRGESAAAKSCARDALGALGIDCAEFNKCDGDWMTRRGFGPGLRRAGNEIFKFYYDDGFFYTYIYDRLRYSPIGYSENLKNYCGYSYPMNWPMKVSTTN